MEKIKEACEIAVAIQRKTYGVGAVETHIERILETDEVYLFDFKRRTKQVIIGGGGILIYKKDMLAMHFCLPACPENIFEILDRAVEVAIPEEYV